MKSKLRDKGFNRVTDTVHPGNRHPAYRRQAAGILDARPARRTSRTSPYEYFYRLIRDGVLEKVRHIPKEHSWVWAAYDMKIPVYTPGYEDSTLGNIFAARVLEGTVKSHNVIKSGTAQMEHLVRWYLETVEKSPIGFFQIGGGIAGDFAICAVPLIIQDLEKDVSLWSYFCQISDSTTSFGSYSGAVPNEKITWWKLDRDAPKFMINSDASIVAPLMFAYVMGE